MAQHHRPPRVQEQVSSSLGVMALYGMTHREIITIFTVCFHWISVQYVFIFLSDNILTKGNTKA